MVLVDRENNIIYVNNEAEKQFGLKQEEVIGKDWTEQTPATNFSGKVDSTIRPSASAVMVAEVTSSIFIIKSLKDGKPVTVNVTATPILLNGYVAGGIIVLKKIGSP